MHVRIFYVHPYHSKLIHSIRGQLCTDLDEVIQVQYHQQIFTVLIPTLEVPEPRYFYSFRQPLSFLTISQSTRTCSHGADQLL